MNSKQWIRKTITSGLTVAIFVTYSMVALAGTGKASGELIVTGNNLNGEAPVAIVNGESAKSGRTIFTSSIVSTPENASARIDLGRTGEIGLSPNTSMKISFDDNAVSIDLTSGSVTVLRSAGKVNVNAGGKTFELVAGDTANAAGKKQDDDDDDDHAGGAAWWLYALIFGGAAAGLVIAVANDTNEYNLGGGSTTVSPTR